MKKIVALLFLILLIPTLAFSMPSDRDSKLTWSHDGDIDLAGFWVYAAPQKETPRVYSDARRFKVGNPSVREVFILDITPDISKSWCFRLTAFDVDGKESAFSNEDCGYFGFTPPNALVVE